MRIERFSRGSARFGTEEQETGLKPLNGFRLKAELRRDEPSQSECRLQGTLFYWHISILFESGTQDIRKCLRKTLPFRLS